ncbi:MAG: hypothetical protein D6731_13235 [Planctomycetota bacterium]|nr:MAG: hypothetical protein D6731_13235 [Planctomycetota bacterium]
MRAASSSASSSASSRSRSICRRKTPASSLAKASRRWRPFTKRARTRCRPRGRPESSRGMPPAAGAEPASATATGAGVAVAPGAGDGAGDGAGAGAGAGAPEAADGEGLGAEGVFAAEEPWAAGRRFRAGPGLRRPGRSRGGRLVAVGCAAGRGDRAEEAPLPEGFLAPHKLHTRCSSKFE